MKKIFLAVIITIIAFTSQAQLAFKYNAGFTKPDKITFPRDAFTSAVGLDYYFSLQKNKIPVLKLSAAYVVARTGEKEVKEYATKNKIDYTSYKLSKSNSNGVLVTTGYRYVFNTKEKATTAFAVELEVGGFFGSGQGLNYYTGQGQLLKTVESNKTMFVYNPHVDFYGRISKNATFKIMAGYSNLTGVNTGVGVTVSKARKSPPPKPKIIKLNPGEEL
jgi:hypothetical protein